MASPRHPCPMPALPLITLMVCAQILDIKVKKLEQLVRLKDAKLQTLGARLEALAAS